MKTIFLIRHSLKEEKYYSDNELVDRQTFDEQKRLSEEGKELAYKLSQNEVLRNVKEVWSSNYNRAIETAKYINENVSITNAFDERHYGDFPPNTRKEDFWVKQYQNKNFKNINGESQKEVRKRFDDKINYILNSSPNDEIAIVAHNSAILFYLLKYCNLIGIDGPKGVTLAYKDKILIKNSIMASPSIMKLIFDDNNNVINIDYIEI